jgi:hypothetical protein
MAGPTFSAMTGAVICMCDTSRLTGVAGLMQTLDAAPAQRTRLQGGSYEVYSHNGNWGAEGPPPTKRRLQG